MICWLFYMYVIVHGMIAFVIWAIKKAGFLAVIASILIIATFVGGISWIKGR